MTMARKNEYTFRVVEDQVAELAGVVSEMTGDGWAAINSFQDFTLPNKPWIYFFARRVEQKPESAGPEEMG